MHIPLLSLLSCKATASLRKQTQIYPNPGKLGTIKNKIRTREVNLLIFVKVIALSEDGQEHKNFDICFCVIFDWWCQTNTFEDEILDWTMLLLAFFLFPWFIEARLLLICFRLIIYLCQCFFTVSQKCPFLVPFL